MKNILRLEEATQFGLATYLTYQLSYPGGCMLSFFSHPT